MDVLSEVLDVSGVRGSAGARIAAAGDWGVEWVRDRDAVVYAVTAGVAYLMVEGGAPRLLTTGDVVVLTTGTAHALSSAPGVDIHSCDVAAADEARRNGGLLRLGDGDEQTQILGASYSHDPAGSTPVFALLPPVIHLRAQQLDASLADIVRLIGHELARPGLATHLVLDRLVDVLLVAILRTWLASSPEPGASWWGVLRDPLLMRAVTRIHEAPGHPWTTEALARDVATSKQTLVRRFRTFADTTPGSTSPAGGWTSQRVDSVTPTTASRRSPPTSGTPLSTRSAEPSAANGRSRPGGTERSPAQVSAPIDGSTTR